MTPEKFIPERFDPRSEYYLTPDGKKRPPFCFSPFIGGKRVCAGKTLAETISKFIVLAILGRYELQF